MSNNTDRNMLGFQDVVKKHFAFLEDQYGFKCVSSDLYTVKYSSDKVYLNIYHERVSYELYFEIGMLPEDYNNLLKANLSDIIAMPGIVNENVFYQASNKNDVYMVVEKLADLARMYAKDALNASLQYFRDIANYRTQVQENALRLLELKTAESKANSAWNVKDYKTVVEVYTQFEKHLNSVQLKRLDFAKKKISL